jgi:predicted PurR-regulated permease PerM
MAGMQGPVMVGYVVALYASIHFVEGNIITPLVQAEAVELLQFSRSSRLWLLPLY